MSNKLYQHKLYFGYYIDLDNEKVYSIKSGRLKEIKPQKHFIPYHYVVSEKQKERIGKICWALSHLGCPRKLHKDELREMCDIDGKHTNVIIGVKGSII